MIRMKKPLILIMSLFLVFGLFPFMTDTADASQYYYFKAPTANSTYKAGSTVPVSFYAGVVLKETKMDAWGNPSQVIYHEMPVTLKVFKGSEELYSKSFTYKQGTTFNVKYTPTTTGTLKLCIYGKPMSLNAVSEELQATMTIKVKARKASAVKKVKPTVVVERTAKKKAVISCTNSYGYSMKIYRATKKNGKYKLIKKTSKSTFTDKKLSASKVYYYKVRLFAKKGKKIYQSKWSAKHKAGKYAYAAGDIVLSYSASKGVKVTWKAIKGAGYYLVGRNTSGTKGEYEIISCEGKETTTYYDKDVTKGKTYYYTVIAEDSNSNGVGKYMSDKYKITIP